MGTFATTTHQNGGPKIVDLIIDPNIFGLAHRIFEFRKCLETWDCYRSAFVFNAQQEYLLVFANSWWQACACERYFCQIHACKTT